MLLLPVLKISKSIILPKKSKSIQHVKKNEAVESMDDEGKETEEQSGLEDEGSTEESDNEVSCKNLKLNGPMFPPKSNVQALIYLQNLLSEINLPALEKDLQG